jgi:hypothetical protein
MNFSQKNNNDMMSCVAYNKLSLFALRQRKKIKILNNFEMQDTNLFLYEIKAHFYFILGVKFVTTMQFYLKLKKFTLLFRYTKKL